MEDAHEFKERRNPASEISSIRTELRMGLQSIRTEMKMSDENRRERLAETVRRLDDLKSLMGEKIDLVRNSLATEIADIHSRQDEDHKRIIALENDHEQRKGSKATLAVIWAVAGAVLAWLGSLIKSFISP